MNIIEQINEYLLETEKFSNEFLPLQNTLTPIKDDINKALEELKRKSQESEDLADKIFYLNRYTDLIKKVENIFESRSKRLQNSLQTLAKLVQSGANTDNSQIAEDDSMENEGNNKLSPEQCAAIFAIINKKE